VAKIGVLALQGDYKKHTIVVEKFGHEAILVKSSESLSKCDGLIIPGGESTTFIKLIDKLDLRQPLINFPKEKPTFGTCAGLIILSKNETSNSLNTLNLIDIEVQRNAYGRQIDSFISNIEFKDNGHLHKIEAVFIRAPKIISCGPSVLELAYFENSVVLAKNKNILVATFHPELSENSAIHAYFLNSFFHQ